MATDNRPDFTALSRQMGADWDRRIRHDYRFWMSDGYADDDNMFKTGERDFEILMRGIAPRSDQVFLELGCGVGRILRAAARTFGQVIGVDVSREAIEKAATFTSQFSNVRLVVGNGVDLREVQDGSVDVAVSFAALSSVPTAVIAQYLKELHRVVRPGGQLRLQMYVGKEQPVRSNDTLHLRCYERERLKHALERVGFSVLAIDELVLPIQVSFKELGIEAVVISLTRPDKPACSDSSDQIAGILSPHGEADSSTDTIGADLEYWMSINYARELAERGDVEKAQEALNYAAAVSRTTAIDVSDLLTRIVKKVDEQTLRPSAPEESSISEPAACGVFEENMRAVRAKFPEVASRLEATSATAEVALTTVAEGPVLWKHGQCLDHPSKPVTAAEAWAKRTCEEVKFQRVAHAVIVGSGAGYHVEALFRHLSEHAPTKRISLVEPSLEVFRMAMRARPCASWIEKLDSLIVGGAPSGQAELPLSGEFDLFFRPQTQAVEPEACQKLRAQLYGARGRALLHPSFAVLGPLHGGTLPMVEYVVRGLASAGQRVRPYDVSAFDAGFREFEKYLRDPARKSSVENAYCETISQMVLESLDERPVDILVCMALAPLSQRALLELRRRGVITVLWFVEDYVRFTYWKEFAKFYDFVFTIQRGKCIEAMRAAGAAEVHYLPVGCDPIVHRQVELTAEEKRRWGSPVSFMGAGYHNRQQLFASLSELPLKLWGTEWPTCKPFDSMVQEGGRRLKPEEYVKVFSATDINLNLHSSHERDGVDPFGDFLNPRTFELACSGAFQLVDHRSLLAEAFEPGKEIAVFRSAHELKEKIAYYLARPEERRRMAEAARARVLSEHTYAHRIQQMLSIIYSSRYEQLKAREEAHPWRKVLERAKPHAELFARCEKAFARGEEPNLDGLISDIVTGNGKLSETEQKLLFLFHVRRQIIRMKQEENAGRQ